MNGKSKAILLLFFVSGGCGLIYESVWSHYVKLFLGHAAYAQTLVLVVFIGGLALGSWLCARNAGRIRNPLRIYAFVEAAIGFLAMAFHPAFLAAINWSYAELLPATCEPASTFCATQWTLAALLLAPQSILLGATFPLVSSAVLRLSPDRPGRDVAALYFLNSLGAVVGVFASAFLLIPSVGLPGTLMTAGIANIAVAIGAYGLSRDAPPALDLSRSPLELAAMGRLDVDLRLVRILLAVAFLTGLSSFIYEIAWIRMLGLVLGASTHSFEIMLASFILGLALGGMWVRNRVDRAGQPVRLLAYVQLAMGICAAATIAVYNSSFDFMAWLLSSLARNDGGYILFNLASTLIALMVMLPATFCAGMTLPLITFTLLKSSPGERALGQVYAINTLGAILGVLIAVHVLLGLAGLRATLLAGAFIDVALGTFLLLMLGPRQGRAPSWPVVIGAAGVFFAIAVASDIDPRRSASGVFRTGSARIGPETRVLFHRDGKTATVDVIESGGVRSIQTNGKSDAAIAMAEGVHPTSDEFTMLLLAALPLGHNAGAKSAAVIGFGSGMSTTMLLASPRLERVDTIEIEPAIIEGAKHFRPAVAAAFDDPRSRVVIDDAKSYFARGKGRYDIIVSEPSNPWVSGVSSLFTEEFYRRLSQYLNEGGVLSQWIHTYEMDAPTLASILGAVSRTFPDFAIYWANDADLVLIARKAGPPGEFDAGVLAYPALQPMLRKLKLADADVVRRRIVARWGTVGPLFASFRMPVNSDYYPIVDQRASVTRFTQARVAELIDLKTAGIPLVEMMEGPQPLERHDAIVATPLEAAAAEAWMLRDVAVGAAEPAQAPAEANRREQAARLARAWTVNCRSGPSFERLLPSLVVLAEATIPYLSPKAAAGMWDGIAASPCASALGPAQRVWLELFRSVARRDASRMSAQAVEILQATRGTKSPATEYAFFAAADALLALGERAQVRGLLDVGGDWVRQGVRLTEIRFLSSATNPATAPPASARAPDVRPHG